MIGRNRYEEGVDGFTFWFWKRHGRRLVKTNGTENRVGRLGQQEKVGALNGSVKWSFLVREGFILDAPLPSSYERV